MPKYETSLPKELIDRRADINAKKGRLTTGEVQELQNINDLIDACHNARGHLKREFIQKTETEEFWTAVLMNDGPEGRKHAKKVYMALGEALFGLPFF